MHQFLQFWPSVWKDILPSVDLSEPTIHALNIGLLPYALAYGSWQLWQQGRYELRLLTIYEKTNLEPKILQYFSPMFVIAQHKILQYHDNTLKYACLTEAHSAWKLAFFLSSIVIFYFVPVIVLFGLYWTISRHLMSDPSAPNRCCPDHPNMRARRQVYIDLDAYIVPQL